MEMIFKQKKKEKNMFHPQWDTINDFQDNLRPISTPHTNYFVGIPKQK